LDGIALADGAHAGEHADDREKHIVDDLEIESGDARLPEGRLVGGQGRPLGAGLRPQRVGARTMKGKV